MNVESRLRLLRVISLSNAHRAYAKQLGIEINIEQRKEVMGMSLSHYYLGLVTDNPNNNYEIHKEDCPKMPSRDNREYLGCFWTSGEALKAAKTKHPAWRNIDGCAICCSEIHTG